MKILSIFAHPDDEIIFGWPVFQKKQIEKFLICVTGNKYRNKALEEIGKTFSFDIKYLSIEEDDILNKSEHIESEIYKIANNFKPNFIFTHNPWGEYKHFNHIEVFNIVSKFDFDLPLLLTDMTISLQGSRFPFVHEKEIESYQHIYNDVGFVVNNKIDMDFYRNAREIYRKHQCWTWGKRNIDESNLFLLRNNKETLHRKQIISLLTSLLCKENCIGVEVGTFKGETTEYLAQSKHIKKIYAIDPYDDNILTEDDQRDIVRDIKNQGSQGEKLDYNSLDELYPYVDNKLKKYTNVQFMRHSSASAIELVNESLDFVFIDANHQKEAVKQDIELWSKKLVPGGLLMGHDYSWYRFRGVVEAVDEFFSSSQSRNFFPVLKPNRSLTVNRLDDFVWWRQKKT